MKKFTLFLSAMLISLMSFAQTPTPELELDTLTLTYDLTNDAVLDRMGRRTVYTTDDVLGDVQIILPTFNTETASYTDASLVVGDSTYAATATFAADTANNKEVYTAVATSTDTIFNVTMTVTYPTVQEYTFFAMDDAEAVADDQGEDGESFIVYEVTGAGMLDGEPVEFELTIDQLNNLEGMIGEAFVMGTATSLYEEEGNLAVSGTAMDDAGNTYNIELWVPLAGGEVEIVITEEVDVTLYNLNLDVQGNMAMVTAGGETGVSFFLTNTTANPASWYGMYFSDQISNIWYGDAQLQAYGDAVYTPDSLTVAFITVPDAEGKAVQYNFTLLPGDEPVVEEPEYPVMEDNITNLIYNAEEQSLSGGPSTQYGLEVFLVLGQDNLDGTFALDLEQSSIALNDNDLTILSGYVKDIDLSDPSAPAATAVIVAQLSEFETYEFHLTMTSAPAEVTIISITDAAVVVDEWKDFPDAPTSNYALTMTADWTNEADGLTYPVKVEVLIYDPNVTEQPDAICNVVVGDLINDPWLGGVDGCYLTITTVEGVVTAKGVVTTSNNIALNLTISGKLPTTALDNIQVGNETMKVIRDGQLIIIKNDVEYNIQGAVVK